MSTFEIGDSAKCYKADSNRVGSKKKVFSMIFIKEATHSMPEIYWHYYSSRVVLIEKELKPTPWQQNNFAISIYKR